MIKSKEQAENYARWLMTLSRFANEKVDLFPETKSLVDEHGVIKLTDYDPIFIKELFIGIANDNIEGQFIIDNNNKSIIDLLCLYARQDPEFEKLGYSLSKGILLRGPVGTGKTILMKALSKTAGWIFNRDMRDGGRTNNTFGIHPTYVITELYDKHGIEIFSNYMAKITCFDDLGVEPIVKRYGNESNVLQEILQRRYDQFNVRERLITHATTNLTIEQLKDIYGARIHSRMKSMFNDIILKGSDRRK